MIEMFKKYIYESKRMTVDALRVMVNDGFEDEHRDLSLERKPLVYSLILDYDVADDYIYRSKEISYLVVNCSNITLHFKDPEILTWDVLMNDNDHALASVNIIFDKVKILER